MAVGESRRGAQSRRTFLKGIGAIALGTQGLLAAPALAKGAGDYRSIHLINKRTDEWLKTVYWVEGDYVPEALTAIDHIMRDWRAEKIRRIDAKTLDIIAATHTLLETSEPFQVISGYRSPETNAMLRRRSRNVARKSYHMRGMAVDLTLKTRRIRDISRAARSLDAGGVGTYSRAEFVHLDSGPKRTWGR
ncbi:MAG: DUF882 domain-containing protein [Pseudomonadota bacterium]